MSVEHNLSLPSLDESLCILQDSIAQAFAEILAKLRVEIEACHESSHARALDIVFRRIMNDALWAVTEVQASSQYKYRNQRYISRDIYERWATLGGNVGTRESEYLKDANGNSLRHEHVFRRENLRSELLMCGNVVAFKDILSRAKSCVVSQAEDQRLRNVAPAVDGWARYTVAVDPVSVYDRVTG